MQLRMMMTLGVLLTLVSGLAGQPAWDLSKPFYISVERTETRVIGFHGQNSDLKLRLKYMVEVTPVTDDAGRPRLRHRIMEMVITGPDGGRREDFDNFVGHPFFVRIADDGSVSAEGGEALIEAGTVPEMAGIPAAERPRAARALEMMLLDLVKDVYVRPSAGTFSEKLMVDPSVEITADRTVSIDANQINVAGKLTLAPTEMAKDMKLETARQPTYTVRADWDATAGLPKSVTTKLNIEITSTAPGGGSRRLGRIYDANFTLSREKPAPPPSRGPPKPAGGRTVNPQGAPQ